MLKLFHSLYLRYQHRCDELEVANGQFKDKYRQLETDKNEIRSFLQNELSKRRKSKSHILSSFTCSTTLDYVIQEYIQKNNGQTIIFMCLILIPY